MIEHLLQPLLKSIPTSPGSYVYKGKDGEVLYVGKAKNLRKRVTSYFQNYRELTARIQIMIDNAVDLEVHPVESEVESLLLEASLIKKYRPKYNVLLKDDKQYSWIKITKDPYPIIYRARNTKDKNAVYFGPFPNTRARDEVLAFLRKEFPFRTCSYLITPEDNAIRKEKRKNGEKVLSRLCTYYHIGRCGGPCEDQISNEDYLENINNIKKFLQNKKKVLVKDLESKMAYFSKNFEFEKAAKIKDQVDSLKYISQKVMVGYGDDEDDVRRITYQRSMKGLEGLVKELRVTGYELFTSKAKTNPESIVIPVSRNENTGISSIKEMRSNFLENFRIECFDISNISGTNPVGAMVVYQGGVMRNDHYRKFKINVKDTPDDFAMMREMLTRRFRYLRPKNELENLEEHNASLSASLLVNLSTGLRDKQASGQVDKLTFRSDESFNSIPDLIIIDGGKGQLGIAVEVLHDLKLDHLKVVGLAKRREEIFVPGEKGSHLFDDKKETLFLIQRIRDEAHRFGITFHRDRRSKAMLT